MPDDAPSPARLEAFSDGVIAVIITIMVLEIKVPHANGFEGLRQLAPGLLIYLMSFSFTGIYWLNHQHLAKRVKKAGHMMQCANLAFLFCLSLLPLGTAYVVDKELTGFAVAVYATSLLIAALAFLWFRLSVHRHLNQRGEMQKEDRWGLQSHLLSILVYLGSIACASFYPRAVLVVIGLLTFLWTLPNWSVRQARTRE
ncbi:MAG TPA: TMEM175 family protein [Bryobacteraceae bacterium]